MTTSGRWGNVEGKREKGKWHKKNQEEEEESSYMRWEWSEVKFLEMDIKRLTHESRIKLYEVGVV